MLTENSMGDIVNNVTGNTTDTAETRGVDDGAKTSEETTDEETNANEETGTDVEAGTGSASGDDAGIDWEARAKEWQALAEQYQGEARAIAEKYDGVKDVVAAAKEKDEKIAALTREHDAALGQSVRYEAALKFGLTLDDLDLIAGGAPDEVVARAERLARRLYPARRDPNIQPGTPVAAETDAFIRNGLKGMI